MSTHGSRPPPQARHFPLATAPRLDSVRELDETVSTCRACPRLVAWREEAARVKRRSFRDWEYWAKPVPGFGPPDAPLGIIGLLDDHCAGRVALAVVRVGGVPFAAGSAIIEG